MYRVCISEFVSTPWNDQKFTEMNRKQVLKYCSNEIFNKTFLKEINSLVS